jgi:hypothetical protein
VTRRIIALAAVIGLAVAVGSCGEPEPEGRATSATSAAAHTSFPETFFAVRNHATEIVEVDSASGKVRRTVVDVGPYRERQPSDEIDPNTYIDGLAIAPDRRTLYYNTGPEPAVGSVHRLALPDGKPERIADGRGPSVSPDGRRLAFVNGQYLQVRDLRTGEDEIFENVVGELGGTGTSWAADSRWLAFEDEGADVITVGSIDTKTKKRVYPRPNGDDSRSGYYAYSPRYRPSDGLLGVVCCGNSDPTPGDPEPGRSFVLHDPETGKEKERFPLPFRADRAAYDPSGSHQLFTKIPGGEVYRYSDGKFLRVPDLVSVSFVAW